MIGRTLGRVQVRPERSRHSKPRSPAMELQSLKAVCIAASLFAAMAFIPSFGADDNVGGAQPDAPRLIAGDSIWSLRLPKEDYVVYKGVVSFDGTGAGGTSMLYPAP